MSTIERTARVMESDPRIRAAFPNWFWPHCGVCGKECEFDVNEEAFCYEHNAENIVYKFSPPIEGQGPDVWVSIDMTDPPNLHHAFAVGDLIEKGACDWYVYANPDTARGKVIMMTLEDVLL